MKKQVPYSGLFFLALLVALQVSSQSQTFDIIRFTPPKDWKKDAKDGVLNYMSLDEAANTFCVVSIYASSASSGDASTDFTETWNDLVVTPFNGEANPKTEIQSTAAGWKTVVGAAPVKQDGLDVYIILTVFSGFGKKVAVRTSLNDQSYVPQVDALLESMVFDKSSRLNSKPVNTVSAPGKGKFGLMSYQVPVGWREQQFSDGVILNPVDLPADESLSIQIMQPLNASGTIEQALAASFAEATSMYNATSMYQADGAYGKQEPKISFTGWVYLRGKGSIKASNGSELGLELFVVKIGSRFERVAILESRKNCGGVSRYFASDRISYRNGIEDFLYSMKFSDVTRQPLQSGVATGGGINGVWEGTIQGTGAALGVKLEVFNPIFFSNGQVYFGNKFPTEGLYELNTRIPPELYPRNWGSYSFSNGSGILKMPFADLPIKIVGNKLIVTKNQRDWPFYKLNSVDGARFDGTYRMSESYGIIPVIQFTRDGQFSDNGAIMTLYHEGNRCVNPGFKPGTGTYVVKDFSIVFNYTDGRKVQVAFLGTDYNKSNPSPATLRMSFNDDPLVRQ